MLSVYEFGTQLFQTEDLDPVYVVLHKSGVGEKTKARLCLAYWCFYHLGVAAKIAEQNTPSGFWQAMMRAAVNESNADGSKPFPRGAERRHFRGQQAIAAVSMLQDSYPQGAEQAIEAFIRSGSDGRYTYNSVANSVQTHKGFGPWIAFKIADMSERVLGYDTDFSDCYLGIYKDPRQGAALVNQQLLAQDELPNRPWECEISDTDMGRIIEHLTEYFCGFNAPPDGSRKVNVQEIETVLCKYKSHYKGHYPLNKDSDELRHALNGWGDLSQHLLQNWM